MLETVTVKEYPVIQEIKDKMLEFGAIGSLMSGSGPTVFGLFTNPKAAQELMRSCAMASQQNWLNRFI